MVSKYVGMDGNTTFFANSQDTQPTGENGNILVETDTGVVYIYDGDTPEWVEMFTLKSAEDSGNAEDIGGLK